MLIVIFHEIKCNFVQVIATAIGKAKRQESVLAIKAVVIVVYLIMLKYAY